MVRNGLGIVLFLSTGLFATSQDTYSQESPTVRVDLPPGISPNDVHINYFMTGPFGGYGGFVTPARDRLSYQIIAAVDGKLAERVKLIAYAPGCQIETLDIQVQSQTVSRQLSCVPLAQTILRGQIMPTPIMQQPSEVEVAYVAMWDHRFFGIADGPVTTFHVATAIPDQSGRFEVSLPDFSVQANLGEAEFRFTLREIKTGNIIASLSPAEDAPAPRGLRVEASYPPLIRFSSIPR
ncbi:MAG TPA: hypothetical protein VGS27_24800 [Candidatus Sulfotelmatobacter sp.]|nr:hypothetical protein [Candidatus Sulfotelmatobacter sp.]